MEKTLRILPLLIVIITFFNCNNKSNYKNKFKGETMDSMKLQKVRMVNLSSNYLKNIRIPEKYDKTIIMSKIVDSCFYVPLETTKNSIIGNIDELKIFDDMIFILDVNKAKAVFSFDLKGNFIRKIGTTGKGPGEYLFPQDFDIDKNNKEVLIFNGNASKIYRYNFEGNFLGDIKLPVRAYAFSCLENGQIILYSGDYENNHLNSIDNKIIYYIDKDGNIISYVNKPNSFPQNINISLLNKSLTSNSGIISYSPILSNTIFEIQNKKINPLFYVDFFDKTLPKNQLSVKNSKVFLDFIKKNDYTYFLGNHIQNDNYLYFNFSYNNKSINCFYNKINDKIIVGNSFKFDSLEYLTPPIPISTYNNYLICFTTPDKLIDKKEAILKNPEISNLIDSKYPSIKFLLKINENDNPIITFYKFKQKLN